jgi:hypothetical protein
MTKRLSGKTGVGRFCQAIPWMVLILWLIWQIPFLRCDPDTQVDVHTRGAWTDEGLYSGTARNFLNTGTIDPYENSLYTRGPLFTFVQIPVFFIFGQSLWVARSMVLLFIALALFMFLKKKSTRFTGVLLISIGFTQFHLFHFSHYAMAEMMGTAAILISLLFILDSENQEKTQRFRNLRLVLASFMLFVAYALKIQFLYIAFLLPVYFLISMLAHLRSRSDEARELRKKFGLSVLITAGWMVLYGLLWYLPNYNFYNYVMSREVEGRFMGTMAGLLSTMRFNFDQLLFVPYLQPLLVTGALAMVAGMAWLLISPGRWHKADRVLFLLGFLWMLEEIHKTSMTYMPHRYMVPAYTATALMVASVLAVFFRQGRPHAFAVVIFVAILAAWQLQYTREAYLRRTNDLETVNQYMKQYHWEGKTITGAWGPSASWGTHARVFPVWHGFLNDDRAADAQMVMTESDQEDSDRSLLLQGIDIRSMADSSRRFPIWRYQVDLYWISKK